MAQTTPTASEGFDIRRGETWTRHVYLANLLPIVSVTPGATTTTIKFLQAHLGTNSDRFRLVLTDGVNNSASGAYTITVVDATTLTVPNPTPNAFAGSTTGSGYAGKCTDLTGNTYASTFKDADGSTVFSLVPTIAVAVDGDIVLALTSAQTKTIVADTLVADILQSAAGVESYVLQFQSAVSGSYTPAP